MYITRGNFYFQVVKRIFFIKSIFEKETIRKTSYGTATLAIHSHLGELVFCMR